MRTIISRIIANHTGQIIPFPTFSVCFGLDLQGNSFNDNMAIGLFTLNMNCCIIIQIMFVTYCPLLIQVGDKLLLYNALTH